MFIRGPNKGPTGRFSETDTGRALIGATLQAWCFETQSQQSARCSDAPGLCFRWNRAREPRPNEKGPPAEPFHRGSLRSAAPCPPAVRPNASRSAPMARWTSKACDYTVRVRILRRMPLFVFAHRSPVFSVPPSDPRPLSLARCCHPWPRIISHRSPAWRPRPPSPEPPSLPFCLFLPSFADSQLATSMMGS